MQLVSNEAGPASPEDLNKAFGLIDTLRVLTVFFVLFTSVLLQFQLGSFLDPELWVAFYLTLAFQCVISFATLFYDDYIHSRPQIYFAVFSIEIALTAVLLAVTRGTQASIYILFLVYIALAGLIFRMKGSLILATWASFLMIFSLKYVHYFEYGGAQAPLLFNILAMVLVGGLSGYLSEQIDFMGVSLQKLGKQFRSLQNLHEMVVENLESGIVTLNLEGHVLYANPAAQTIFRLMPNEHEKWANVIDSLRWREWVQDPEGPLPRERDVQMTTGEKKVIELWVSRLNDEEGEIRGYLLGIQDRTLIKKIESQMRQKEKLAAVGQLAAGIAHEIRNPLASMSGSIQLLMGQYKSSNDEDKKLMNIVIKEIDRLNGLIAEFLDFVRPEGEFNDVVDLAPLVRDCVELAKLNKNLRQDIQLQLTLESKFKVKGNRDKLKQAFLNIIINAYQSMDRSLHPKLQIQVTDSARGVRVMIKDTGSGIPGENIPRIFEPFHTTKAKGTGLGLAITHRVIESHKGRIFVESEVGQGTTFMVEIPVVH